MTGALRRTEIMAKIRWDTAFMEKTAVRLDCLDHPAPTTELLLTEHIKSIRRADMRQAIRRTRENLDQLEGTLGG